MPVIGGKLKFCGRLALAGHGSHIDGGGKPGAVRAMFAMDENRFFRIPQHGRQRFRIVHRDLFA